MCHGGGETVYMAAISNILLPSPKLSIIEFIHFSVRKSGPRNRKKTANRTDLDRFGPDC